MSEVPHPGFDAFDARARQSLQRAREASEADGLGYIGTEQLLIGLLAQRGGSAKRALHNFGVELEAARTSLRHLRPLSAERVEPAGEAGGAREVELTPTGKRMLELAVDEARVLGNRSISTEHLLLGLIALGEGAAVDMLRQRGVDLAALRSRTLQLSSGRPARLGQRLTISPEALSLGLPGSAALDTASGAGGEWPTSGRTPTKNNVVMCRVDDIDMDAIDMLIEAGVRTNRSDAAGWLIKVGLESKRAVLDAVRDKVLEIRRIREDARTLAENAEAQA
jgi:hypothetical protein